MSVDAPDTGAVAGTARYWNNWAACGCLEGLAKHGHHTQFCAKGRNETPRAKTCNACGFATATENGRCGVCGEKK